MRMLLLNKSETLGRTGQGILKSMSWTPGVKLLLPKDWCELKKNTHKQNNKLTNRYITSMSMYLLPYQNLILNKCILAEYKCDKGVEGMSCFTPY